MLTLRALIYQALLIITVVPYAFACLLWAPLPLDWRYRLTRGWPRFAIWCARHVLGVRWQIKGLENLPAEPAVILSKHQSAWETMFFIAYLPQQVCFVYKKELHRIPFFGWGLALLKMIPIDRSMGRNAMEQIKKIGGERLAQGRWPLLFPEGTRIAPGKTGRYKIGGALLAHTHQVNIVPIALNSGECWPRNAFIKTPGLITVSIGPAISTRGLTAEQANQQAEDWIEAEMRQLNPERYCATEASPSAARA
ncbi:MAG TPA: lysophospholipid acyltransferase family protein [Paenalcaligenes sp.]|nr:lysophospholipid acyltransferase family protein [Paenalcaligenes sp.]